MIPESRPSNERSEPSAPHIGTLNEKSLHADLKSWYEEEGDRFEVPVEGFVADIVRGDLIIEIQTGSTSALRRKLAVLLTRHPVRLALPIATRKTLVRIDDLGRQTGTRRSPKRGDWIEVFGELTSLRELLGDPNLSVDVVLIHEEEIRCPTSRRRWKDWTVHDRRLVEVVDCVTFQDPIDYLAFIPTSLEEPFTTGELAVAIGRPRSMAQKVAYTLRHLGSLRVVGKRGNAFLYEREIAIADPEET